MIPHLAGYTTLHVLAVLFFATLVRSSFGFGEAMFAVPLLALVMPVETAAPIAVLCSITVAAVVVLQDWHNVHVRSAGSLGLSALFGIPLGLLLLKIAPESIIKTFLAVVIMTFSLYSLFTRRRYELKNDRLAWLFGFGSGVLGGAYGMNGPPLVIYGVLRGWSPVHFRATLQGYFLIASVVGMIGYAIAGLWTRAVSGYYLVSLPLVLIAILIGRHINRRLDGRRFLLCAYIVLALIGAVLLKQAWRA